MGLAEDFPTRYEPKNVEPKWQKFWAEKKLYQFNESEGAKNPSKIYSIDTPPPTVSGKLHIGHVFSYTHTEITSRFKRMKGFNVYYPFGYDDNGLPTELLTEKDHGVRAHQVERSEFRRLCRETGSKYSQLFRDLWIKLGFSCDFDSAYSTISATSQKISQWSFVDLYKKGKVERRKEPALWCTKLQTSFSQAEIEVEYIAGQFVHIPFTIDGLPPLQIATTRPELLPACVSVFVHPDDERFKPYWGKMVKVPFFGHEVPVLKDDKAQMDKGTGAVMCCTFGDTTDIHWWRQHKLPLREAINKFGKMTEICGPLTGLKIEEARQKMIELLTEQNLVLKVIPIKAEDRPVNTYERSGAPVEYIVQPQWFIKVCDIKDELIEFGRKVKWYPEFMRARYESWVQNLSWDWAISRQRAFGVPIPAWVSEDGQHIHVADFSQLPVDPLESKPSLPCPQGEWRGEADVLDTWATSSVTPLINARWTLDNERKSFLPMSMRPQAHDIIRTWAFYTILKSYYHFDEVPWTHAVISGHVKKPEAKVDGQQLAGQQFVKKTKISKSKDGETYAPDKILERQCADAIRLWSAGASLGVDILFDENGMAEAQKFLNKLWNASRFALMQMEGFTPNPKIQTVNPEDHWMRARIKEVHHVVEKSVEDYELHRAKVELDKLFWITFCDNYIEFVKCRVQSGTDAQKQSAFQTLYDSLLMILKMYAPYAPHITEEIYQIAFKRFENIDSMHQLRLSDPAALTPQETQGLKQGEALVELIGAVRTFKSKRSIGFKIPAEEIHFSCDAETLKLLQDGLIIAQNFASAPSVKNVDSKALPADAQESPGKTISVWIQYNEENLKKKSG